MPGLRISKDPRRLGETELYVGPISYGCWRFSGTDLDVGRRKIETALDSGMTLFDTADIYGRGTGEEVGAAETLLGDVLNDAPSLRDQMVLATKCGIIGGVPYDSSAEHIRSACEESLRRLRIECIDLYQIHRPDLLAHPEEVATALAALRSGGKIREVGVSNYSVSQLEALRVRLPFSIATHQIELSAGCIEPFFDGVLDQCIRRRITPLAWSPLAGGAFGSEAAVTVLDRLAQEKSTTRLAVALAFLLVHPSAVIPIVGTQRLERIREAATALQVELTRSEWYDIVEAARGEPLP